MNAWLLVYALGAGQGALLALALWQRRHEAAGQGLLAAWIALASLDLAVRALYLADPGPDLLRPYRVVGLFPFLHASAFYLYCRTVVRGDGLRRADLLHLGVFALAVLAWGDLLLLDAAGLAELYRALAAGRIPARAPWLDLAMMAWGLACLLLALRLVWRYRRRLLASASDGDPGALRWLIAMGLSQALIWAIAFGQWLTTLPWLSYRLIYAAVAAWVFLVGYLALVRPQVPRAAGAIDAAAAAGPPAPEPSPAADHEDPRADAVAARIDALMTQGRVHREPALTIAQLARRSGYPEYLVSAVINRRHGVPFWEFVNRHRIADVCAALADPGDTRTVLEIAFDAGFSAKSTFNAAFKRLQGETPAAYRRRCAADPAAATRRPAG